MPDLTYEPSERAVEASMSAVLVAEGDPELTAEEWDRFRRRANVFAKALLAHEREENLSPHCTCGHEHRPSGMAGTDLITDSGKPRKPGCRQLTWQELYERMQLSVGKRRKEGREFMRRAEAAEAKLEVLEQRVKSVKWDSAGKEWRGGCIACGFWVRGTDKAVIERHVADHTHEPEGER